ncbi:MAG: MFS transporter [Ignavibacterium sp.]|nr:MFS transporter [Ignavibacterium sp.]
MIAASDNPPSKLILWITTLASFMTAFMGSSINIALPVIGDEFNANALLLSWLSTAYIVTTAALLLPVGKLTDLYGRTKFFKWGVILFTSGSILSAVSFNTIMLLIFRVIQGIGSSFIFSCSTAILVSVFPLSQRGRVLGINTAAVYTGLSSGPFLGGLITQNLNWRGIFYINALLGIALIVFNSVYLKHEWQEFDDHKYDYKGAAIYILSIILLMISVSLFPEPAGFLLLAISILSFMMLYSIESKTSHPIFNILLFRSNKTFTMSNTAALINYSATFAISFLMSFYLQSVKMLNPEDAGIILITQPVMQALFSPLSGRLSDKTEPGYVASAGMGLLTIGLIVFCFLSKETSCIIIVGNLAMMGFGFALFSSPNVNAIMSSVEQRFYGVASSTLASMRMIGQMVSMGIVIIIISVFIGSEKISAANQDAFLTSLRTAFILFSLLCFLGVFASLARGKVHK